MLNGNSYKNVGPVLVFLGSNPGLNGVYLKTAKAFGQELAEHKIRLIYGGSKVGCMGELASSVLEHGGEVTGIIPDFLKGKEPPLDGVQELIVTKDMHERKRIMFERCESIVALPGGVGTLEELIEQMTWRQLGRHKKPILLANIGGFWDPLIELLNQMRKQRFIRPDMDVEFLEATRVEDILPILCGEMKCLRVNGRVLVEDDQIAFPFDRDEASVLPLM